MKLKEYVEGLVNLLIDNPGAADFTVVTSADDEGNGFNLVYYGPSIGHYDRESREFETTGEMDTVCVN